MGLLQNNRNKRILQNELLPCPDIFRFFLSKVHFATIPINLKGTHMFRKKKTLPDIKKTLINELQSTLQDNLVSILIYGKDLNHQYLSQRSKHKFLIILNNLTKIDLDILANLQKSWIKKYNLYPLILTKSDIYTSSDIFPIEFLDIKDSYELVWGEDIFKDLKIPIDNLRTQCEFNLKGKIIVLRQAYLATPNKQLSLIKESYPAFLLVFRNILRLLNILDHHTAEDSILEKIGQKIPMDISVFKEIEAIIEKNTLPNKYEKDILFNSYLQQLNALSEYIDKLEITKS